jgi:FkbM family methyltransferase
MYYGQFNPPVDKVLHDRYFHDKVKGISIECGAYNGVTDSCTKFFEDQYAWKTINIEPLQPIFNDLTINRPHSINLHIALSNNNNDKVFTNYKHPQLGFSWGNGSLNHTDSHKTALEKLCGHNNYETQLVKCCTYAEVIKNLNITSIDLFVLDVEGHELEVIDGMIGCHILPDVFVIEVGHITIEQITEKLKCLKQSYKLDHISFVNAFFIKESNTI